MWGSEKQAYPSTESAHTLKPASAQAKSKPLTSAAELAIQRVRPQSRSRSWSGQSRRRTWTLSYDSDIASDDSAETASHAGC